MRDLPRIRVMVGMPAFNEEKYIGSIVLQSRQYFNEVVVVDDGSSDKTPTIAELAGAAFRFFISWMKKSII